MLINGKEYDECPMCHESTNDCNLKALLTPAEIVGRNERGLIWEPENKCDENCPAKEGITFNRKIEEDDIYSLKDKDGLIMLLILPDCKSAYEMISGVIFSKKTKEEFAKVIKENNFKFVGKNKE